MTELFLAVNKDPAITRSSLYNYYFVDHYQRCIYWLEEVQADKVYESLQGIQQLADISTCSVRRLTSLLFIKHSLEFAMEAQYWYALQLCLTCLVRD